MRAPKELLYELQFFFELLHDGVYGAEFVKQSQTPKGCSVQDTMTINIIDFLDFLRKASS